MVIEIIVGNSYSQIKGLDSKAFSQVKKLLSYEDNPQAAYYTGGFARTRYLIDAKGNFPTGLLNRLARYLRDVRIDHTIVRKKHTCVQVELEADFGDIVPYPDQQAAVTTAMVKGRGILSLPTGTGKSLVIALLIDKLKLSTLIVVPNLELKYQLTESLESIFGETPHIRVENIDSAALKTAKGYDCLIIDECHHSAARTYHKLNKTAWTGISKRFCLTATPYRNQDNEQLLFEAICGQVIYKLSYEDAVKRGYIVPVEAYYVTVPASKTEADTWQGVYKELVVHNEARNDLIGGLLTTLLSVGAPTLCLVKEIAHGNALSDLTGIPFANGQDEASRDYIRQFSANKISALIATTGVVGEGVDTKPCEYVVIAGLGKAKSAFMQQVGRAVRRFTGKESAKVIVFKDKSHKWTISHFNTQKSILLEEYGISAIPLDL